MQNFQSYKELISEYCINHFGKPKDKSIDFENTVFLFTMNSDGKPLFLVNDGLME